MAAELEAFEKQQIAVISPLKVRSLELRATAGAIVVTDDNTLTQALKVKKDITAHGKTVKELRLELTRPLDNITKQLIAAEKEILLPLTEGKDDLSSKILDYENKLAAERKAELERVEAIVQHIDSLYHHGMTEAQVAAGREAAKKVISELSPADKEIPGVQLALLKLSNAFTDRMNDINIEKQRAQKQKLEDDETRIANEQRRIDAEVARKELEKKTADAAKAQAKADKDRPKTNTATYTEFEIINPDLVPRELCSPDDKKIRAFLKDTGIKTDISGIRVFETQKVR